MKRKLLYSLFSFSLLLTPFLTFFSSASLNKAQAANANCTDIFAHSVAKSTPSSPAPADNSDFAIRLGITISGVPDGTNSVALAIKPPNQTRFNFLGITTLGFIEDAFDISGGKISTDVGHSNEGYSQALGGNTAFTNGPYGIAVLPVGETNIDNAYCTIDNAFTIIEATTPNPGIWSCKIKYADSNQLTIFPSNNPPVSVAFKVDLVHDDTSDDTTHRNLVEIKSTRNQKFSFTPLTSDIRNGNWPIPQSFPVGSYSVTVYEQDQSILGGRCESDDNFTIGLKENGGGYLGCKENNECTDPDSNICLPDVDKDGIRHCGTNPAYDPGKVPYACKFHPGVHTAVGGHIISINDKFTCHTAIGDIDTDPEGFAKSVLKLVLGLAGGILLILIIINGFKFMTSQGDPEKIKDAREGIIAAITGILLIIFSIAILQIITVNILSIPGFR